MHPLVRLTLVVVGLALVGFAVRTWDADKLGRAEPGRSGDPRMTALLHDGPAVPALVGIVFAAVGVWPRRRRPDVTPGDAP